MRTTQQHPHWLSQSSRKGVVIDLDLIVAYLLFITTVLALINFSISLTAPFANNVEIINKEKSTIAVRNLVNNRISLSDFNDACSIRYLNMRLFSLEYQIKGFYMPFTDSEYYPPNTFNGSIIIVRENNDLHLMTGSNATIQTITVEMVFDNEPSVFNISLESADFFTITKDDFDKTIITMQSTVNNGDVDKITIKGANGLVSVNYNGVSDNVYLGTTKITDYCGTRGIAGSTTSFSRYGILNNGREDYYATLRGDIWWTN